jgi:hypothetical protein
LASISFVYDAVNEIRLFVKRNSYSSIFIIRVVEEQEERLAGGPTEAETKADLSGCAQT